MNVNRRQFLLGSLALGAAAVAQPALTGCSSEQKPPQPDTIYINAKVYTANAKSEWAEAFFVSEGRFVAVGTNEEIQALADSSTKVVDLVGDTVIPGLIEGHNHFSFMAAMHSLGYEELPPGTTTIEDSLKLLKKFIRKHPDYDQYVLGNFSQELDLDAKKLDEICSDKPVACVGMGLHCLYMNSKFMEAGNITKDTPDAIPGQTYYVRDKEGNPTGKIVELTQTWDAFQKAIKIDNEKLKEKFLEMQDLYHSFGFTGVAEGGFLGLDENNMLDVITGLENEGKLKMVVCPASIWYGHTLTSMDEFTQRVIGNKEKYTTDLVRPGTAKMWADGTIGAHSALMRKPYVDKNTKGSYLSTNDDLIACAKICKENDLNVHYHAIGDQAIANVLTAYETAGETTGVKSIAHFQINSPDLIKRAAKIPGLIVNCTPTWASVAVPEEVEPLGKRRETNCLFKESMDAGLTVNFGADSNGAENNWSPSYIMTTAMIRDPKEDHIFLKGKPCTFEEAVDAYSINVAKERRIEEDFGSIEVGKYANFVIWEKDVMDIVVNGGEIGMMLATTVDVNEFAQEVFFKGENVFTRE